MAPGACTSHVRVVFVCVCVCVCACVWGVVCVWVGGGDIALATFAAGPVLPTRSTRKCPCPRAMGRVTCMACPDSRCSPCGSDRGVSSTPWGPASARPKSGGHTCPETMLTVVKWRARVPTRPRVKSEQPASVVAIRACPQARVYLKSEQSRGTVGVPAGTLQETNPSDHRKFPALM